MSMILTPVRFLATLLLGSVIAFASAPAFAGENVGSGLIGNTVELTGAAGTTKIYYRNRDNLQIKMPDGKVRRGWWRVKGRSICTRTGDAPENCTPPVDIPPVVGSAGVIKDPGAHLQGGDVNAGDITWIVKKGKTF